MINTKIDGYAEDSIYPIGKSGLWHGGIHGKYDNMIKRDMAAGTLEINEDYIGDDPIVWDKPASNNEAIKE